MAADIDEAFVQQYDTEVKLTYQRMGSKLANTVRRKTNVKGSSTTFNKAGSGTAATKTRHGLVPLMNIDHSTATCTLADYYAADYVDKLDELKIQIDERKVITDNAAAAQGRASDDLIVTAGVAGASVDTAAGGTGLTEAKVAAEFEFYGSNDIPDENRFWLIPVQGWTDLLSIDGFSNADFVGSDDLPYKRGMRAKVWMSFMFIPYNGLPNGDGGATEVKTLNYHGQAIGHASGMDATSEVNYVPERAAFLFNTMMSQGACVIDSEGVRTVDILK